ncbi:unnamed protein product [Prorocentrum cordatum]|uniref:Uncharacterized protein n=1 Tax=Prorocentrum cordatum TaxID=2364126 RepID=A0ABN9RCF9_9DINO|nr:unnamed protein product [Polarella glacialis]
MGAGCPWQPPGTAADELEMRGRADLVWEVPQYSPGKRPDHGAGGEVRAARAFERGELVAECLCVPIDTRDIDRCYLDAYTYLRGAPGGPRPPPDRQTARREIGSLGEGRGWSDACAAAAGPAEAAAQQQQYAQSFNKGKGFGKGGKTGTTFGGKGGAQHGDAPSSRWTCPSCGCKKNKQGHGLLIRCCLPVVLLLFILARKFQGDEESAKRYQHKLDEMAAAKKVEPPLQQKVNQAYHSMRSLEARLSKAVESFERISNELVQARANVESITSQLEASEKLHKELVEQLHQSVDDRPRNPEGSVKQEVKISISDLLGGQPLPIDMSSLLEWEADYDLNEEDRNEAAARLKTLNDEIQKQAKKLFGAAQAHAERVRKEMEEQKSRLAGKKRKELKMMVRMWVIQPLRRLLVVKLRRLRYGRAIGEF